MVTGACARAHALIRVGGSIDICERERERERERDEKGASGGIVYVTRELLAGVCVCV